MLTPDRMLVRAHQRALGRLRRATTAAVVDAWAKGADVEAVARLVLSGQTMTVRATDAGLSFLAGVTTGTTTEPVGVDASRLIGARARNGTVLEEVYSRPQVVSRAEGSRVARQYLQQQVVLDMQLAQRGGAFAQIAADNRAVGWRRVLSPSENCGLCIAASTRVYRRGDILPLHHNCRCSVVSVLSTSGLVPGKVFDRDRLDAVYEQTGGATDYQSLRRVEIDIDQLPPGVDAAALESLQTRIEWHSEIGPMLTGNSHSSQF